MEGVIISLISVTISLISVIKLLFINILIVLNHVYNTNRNKKIPIPTIKLSASAIYLPLMFKKMLLILI